MVMTMVRSGRITEIATNLFRLLSFFSLLYLFICLAVWVFVVAHRILDLR